MIKVLYFASLAEQLQCTEEQIEFSQSVNSIFDLKNYLAHRGAIWHNAFNGKLTIICALNQEVSDKNSIIHDGDEIAFYPPVTGG